MKRIWHSCSFGQLEVDLREAVEEVRRNRELIIKIVVSDILRKGKGNEIDIHDVVGETLNRIGEFEEYTRYDEACCEWYEVGKEGICVEFYNASEEPHLTVSYYEIEDCETKVRISFTNWSKKNYEEGIKLVEGLKEMFGMHIYHRSKIRHDYPSAKYTEYIYYLCGNIDGMEVRRVIWKAQEKGKYYDAIVGVERTINYEFL